MDRLPKNLAEARLYLKLVKPWAVIAAVAAMIVVGFYSLEGWRYWEAWNGSKEMKEQISRIRAKVDREIPKAEGAARDLDVQENRLEYFEEMFNDVDVSTLIGTVSTTSWETGVEVPAISVGDPSFQDIGSTRYLTQSLSLTARGDINDIYSFLSNLHTELPVLAVPNISISAPGPEATAQIQLTFYLQPEYNVQDEAAD